MKVLGLRCGSNAYSFAVVEGSQASPQIVGHGTVNVPKGFGTGPRLGWMRQEIIDTCKKHGAQAICLKGTEGLAARGSAFVNRIEMEAVVFLSAHEIGIRQVVKKVKSTLAKDLGEKGKAKYLSHIDYSVLPEFDSLTENEKEAVLAAWSHLP